MTDGRWQMTNDRWVSVAESPPRRLPIRNLSFVICHKATSFRRARFWVAYENMDADFSWSDLMHSALAAATLQVAYQDKKVSLDASDLAKLPVTEVDASDHQTKHRYSGVLVRDILGLVGAPFGEALRGKALSLVVRITANDNYIVVFALAEFDPGFSDRSIILAAQQDGQPLPDNAAPFRIVIPGDTHPARWIRQVRSIEVIPLNQ
jgi:DMSO/TMAO reductase YedYZ molybdopterin-dependent catalytic subunit